MSGQNTFTYGSTSPQAHTLLVKGLEFIEEGDWQNAMPTLRKSVSEAQRVIKKYKGKGKKPKGIERAYMGAACMALGYVMFALGNIKKTTMLYKKSLQYWQAVLGKKSPDLLLLMKDVVTVCMLDVERVETALPILYTYQEMMEGETLNLSMLSGVLWKIGYIKATVAQKKLKELGKNPPVETKIAVGHIVDARWDDGHWYIAQVIGLAEHTSGIQLYKVKFVEYNDVATVPLDQLQKRDNSDVEDEAELVEEQLQEADQFFQEAIRVVRWEKNEAHALLASLLVYQRFLKACEPEILTPFLDDPEAKSKEIAGLVKACWETLTKEKGSKQDGGV